jgi:Ca2+/Na+ antiporter
MFQALTDLYTSKHGELSRKLRIQTVGVFVLIIVLFNLYFPTSLAAVVLLLAFAFVAANMFVEVRTHNDDDFNSKTMYKLGTLQDFANKVVASKQKQFQNTLTKVRVNLQPVGLKCLYTDSTLIHFFHDILPLAKYNQIDFFLLLKGANNILCIRNDIERFYEANASNIQNIAEQFEIAISLKTQTINNFHNLIYSVPKTSSMYEYLHSAMERYNVLISRNLDIIHKYYLINLQQNGYNTSTKIVSYDQTKPFDALSNYSLTPNKQETAKLLDFYV